MNPFVLIGPAGMVAVGALSMVIWHRRSGAHGRFFFLGGCVWLLAVIPKYLLDLMLTTRLSWWLYGSFGLNWTLALLGVYLGVRTGLLECAAAYLAVDRSELRHASVDEVIATAIGFGGTEALALGLPSFLQMATYMIDPGQLELLDWRHYVEMVAQLNAPTWIVAAPIIERAFVLLAHVLSFLLIYASVERGRPHLLLLAFFYKGLLDFPTAYFQWLLASGSLMTVYIADVWVVLLGCLGLLWSVRLRRQLSAP
ncbi:YhfC family intramembrane metalloprotease [Candidatus Bathyarchaeota archaeon]|nr:YhfC family intramembrane metalloprotease [Candidatus Bathyarchaeota archaeon]